MAAGGAPRRRWPGRQLARTALAAAGLALLLRGVVAEPHLVTSSGMAPTLLPGDLLLVSRLAYGLRLPFTDVVALALAPPRRGDVVVFRDPTEPGRRLVKRVVGLPGEVVELREQTLLVDGVAQPRLELGPLTYLEPGEAGAPGREDTCRRWREILTLGPQAAPPDGVAPPSDEERWEAARARLARGEAVAHDQLQCRRLRAGRRQGPFGPVRPGHVFVLGDNRDRSADSREGWEVPLGAVVGRGALVGWSWGDGGWWPGGGAGVRIDRLFKPVE